MFPDSVEELEILVVESRQSGWWNSCSSQIRRSGIREQKVLKVDYNSWAHLNRNGWLMDFNTLYQVYRAEFGAIKKISYSQNVILDLLAAMGMSECRGIELYEDRRVPAYGIKTLYKRHFSRTSAGAFWRRFKTRFNSLAGS